jgi:hypothetical protein
MGFEMVFENEKFLVMSNNNPTVAVMKGDILYKFQGETLNLQSAEKIFSSLKNYKPGDEVKLSILRNGTEIEMDAVLQASAIKHIFTVMENPTEAQLKLREIWMSNL